MSHGFPVGQWHCVFHIKYEETSFLKRLSIADTGQIFKGKFMGGIPLKEVMIRSCQVAEKGSQIHCPVIGKTVNETLSFHVQFPF